MRIKDLVEGNVIDARDRFKKQNSIDPSELQSHISSALKSHKEFEEWVADQLNKIQNFPNKQLNFREKMSLSPIFALYQDNVQFTKALMWTITDPDDLAAVSSYHVKSFIQKNKEKILEIIEQQIRDLFNLENKIKEQNIPSSLIHHTKFNFVKAELNELHNFYRTISF